MENLDLIVDFVNTAELEAGLDRLGDPHGLDEWLARHGLADAGANATAADAADARAVREALRELLRANNNVEIDRDASSAILDAAAGRAGLSVRFEDGAIRFASRKHGVAGALARVLAVVGSAMADGSWQRLKACRSDTCRWAFVDNARNRSRQWCDMSVCGNREKARTFRARHETAHA